MSSAGDRLRAAREAAGHRSARVAANAIGIGYSTFLSHENGTNGFTAEQARFYADAFGVSPAWLLTGDTTAPAIAALVDLLTRKGLITDQEAIQVLSAKTHDPV